MAAKMALEALAASHSHSRHAAAICTRQPSHALARVRGAAADARALKSRKCRGAVLLRAAAAAPREEPGKAVEKAKGKDGNDWNLAAFQHMQENSRTGSRKLEKQSNHMEVSLHAVITQ